jgi:hypothetical protein
MFQSIMFDLAASPMRRPFGLTDGRGCLGRNLGRMGRQGWKMCWRMAGKIGGESRFSRPLLSEI